MIKANKGVIDIEGTREDVMAELIHISVEIIDMVIADVSAPLTREEVMDDINDGIRFTFLVKSGMTQKEAAEVMFPGITEKLKRRDTHDVSGSD